MRRLLLMVVLLVAPAALLAAPIPRELKDVQPKIEREVKKSRSVVDSAKRKLARAAEQLVQAEANLQTPDDPNQLPKLTARRDKLQKSIKALEAKVADADKAAHPSEQAARALADYGRGNWKNAFDGAEAARASWPGGKAVDRELAYISALARMRLGELKEAVERLDKPDLNGLGEAQRFLGIAKLRLGDAAAAEQHLTRARLANDDGEAHAALGEIYLKAKKVEPAAASLERAVKAYPGDTRLLGLLGRAQLELGRNAEAARTLDKLVKLAPRDHEAAYLEAVARARAGDPQGAERALSRYLQKARRTAGDARYERPQLKPLIVPTYGYEGGLPVAPDDGAARNQVAVYLAERGEYEQARRELDAAKSDDPRALYNRGLVELSAGRLAQARSALDKAQSAAPDRPGAPHALGVTALVAGDTAAALAAFNEAARRAPKDDLPRLGLAVAGGKGADAEKALKALAEKSGKVGHAARVDLAALRIAAGQAQPARDALGTAGGEDERIAEAAYVRGLIDEAQGASSEAMAAYGRAVALAPNYFDALTALGRVAEQRGDHAAARVALERAVALQPKEPEPHAMLAKALAGLGDARGAAAAEETARRLTATAKADGQKLDDGKPAKVVGVTAFANTNQDAKHAWLSVGIAEALSSDLPKLGGIRVVERAQLQKAFDEARLQQLAAVDDRAAPEVGKMVGADALVIGSYQIVAGQIRVLGRLVSVQNGTVLRAGEASGKLDDLFAIERKLALDLLADYAGLPGTARDAFFKQAAPAMAGLEAVSKAQVALAKGDTAEAKAQMGKAGEADATFASQFADVKKSAEASANVAVLPFTNSSRRAADDWLKSGIAEALSGDLRKLGVPQVERLAIEKIMQEKRFGELFSDGGGDTAQAGKQIGAKALIVGSFQTDGNTIRMDARLVEVATQKVLLADHVDGKVADLFQLETQLAVNLGKQLNPKVSDADAAELRDDHPPVAEFEKKMRERGGGDLAAVKVMAEAAPREVATRLARSGVAFVAAGGSTAAPPPPARMSALPAVLETRVVLNGDRVRIDGRVIDKRNNVLLAASSAEGPRAQAAQLEDQVAHALAQALAALPPPPAPAGVR